MKVMQINAVYPNGSTGKIVNSIHKYIVNIGCDSVVYYGRGSNVQENNIHKIAPEYIMKLQSLQSKLTGFAYAGAYISTKSLINSIKNEQPDIVHLHCINAYTVNVYKLLNYLKINNIPTVVTLHAEFMYTAGCAHSLDCEKWKIGCGNCPQKGNGRPSSRIFDKSSEEWEMMYEAFNGFENIAITSVSGWLSNRAKLSPFFEDKNMFTVLNGIDTETFTPTDYSNLKLKYGITDERIILHVTPNFNHPIKGGKYVLDIAKKMLDSNVKIFIVGNADRSDNWPANIIHIKHTTDSEELAALYALAHITVLTSKKETFSMVTAESLSCGTPVIGFKAGAPETIAIKEYSEFVNHGDITGLIDAVNRWINYKTDDISKKIALNAKYIYSQNRMSEEYYKIYKGLTQ